VYGFMVDNEFTARCGKEGGYQLRTILGIHKEFGQLICTKIKMRFRGKLVDMWILMTSYPLVGVESVWEFCKSLMNLFN